MSADLLREAAALMRSRNWVLAALAVANAYLGAPS